MRIAVISYGTRGDVQPLVSVAHALRARGHDVVFGAPHDHLAFAAATGLDARPIAGSSDAILGSPEGKAWLREGNALRLVDTMATQMRTLAEEVERDIEAIVGGADAIVTGILAATMVRVFADQYRIPYTVAQTFPALPSRHLNHSAIDLPDWAPGWTRIASTRLLVAYLWRRVGAIDTEVRQRRGLEPASCDGSIEPWQRGRPSVHLWSPALVPRPADWPHEILTGFCTLPRALRTPLGETDALEAIRPFLEAGPPPVYIGLGSMPVMDLDITLPLIRAAAEKADARVLLGGTLPDAERIRERLPDTMALVGPIDHETLFAQCRTIVHHGGAGTTAASVRSGRPTLICPVLGDQPFWGRVVARQGAGAVLPFRRWTPDRLADALRRLEAPETVENARRLGERLRAEPPGADVAAEALEGLFRRG